MNDFVFEGVVSDVLDSSFETRNHDTVHNREFIVTEDEGLHPFRQKHNFCLYGDRFNQYADRVRNGARVRVHFSFTGVNTSAQGRRYNSIGTWSVEAV